MYFSVLHDQVGQDYAFSLEYLPNPPFTVSLYRSKAHRVPFADITVKKEKKGKGKGKKVESSKVNEEPTPQLPLKKSVLGGWGSGSKKIDTRTDSKQKGKSSRQDSEIKTPPKQQHQSDKAKEKEALIKQAQNAQPRRLLFCCF